MVRNDACPQDGPRKARLTADLIKRKIKAPTPTGKPICYYDTQVRGLAVVASGTTDRKTFIVTYGTRFQRRTIGDVSLFTLTDARDKAMDMLKLMRRGIDPNTVDKRPKDTTTKITIRELLDRRVRDQVRPLRPASIEVYETVIKKHLEDWLDRPVTDMTADAVHDRHRAIFRAADKANGRDGKTVADLTIRVLGALITYGKTLKGSDRIDGLPEINPVAGIVWFHDKPVKRTRHIGDADLPKFWVCANDLTNPTYRTLLKVLLLTGLRVNSARCLRWTMIDLDNRVIRIPAELMKGKRPHELPIVSGLFEILDAWRQRGVECIAIRVPVPDQRQAHHGAAARVRLHREGDGHRRIGP